MNRSAVQERLSPFFAPVWPVIVAPSVPVFSDSRTRPPGLFRPRFCALRHSRSQSISLARQGKKLLVGKG